MSVLSKLKELAAQIQLADQSLSLSDAINRIEKLNDGLRAFWSASEGWAPQEAADLMSKSRLDRQLSLSRSLRHWNTESPETLEDGDLILGWTNLGSLIEGTIKLFLAVYFEDYKADLSTLKLTQAWHAKKEKLLEPDGLRLEVLIDYIEKADLFDSDDLTLFKLVQKRRNAIHAFKDSDIGSGAELHTAIKSYLGVLRATAARLPYPDYMYEPSEL